MSLRFKILLLVLFPLVVIVIGSKVIDYTRYEAQSESEIKEKLLQKAQQNARAIGALLSEASASASTLSDMLSLIETVSEEQIYELLKLNMRGSRLIYGSAVAYLPWAYEERERFSPYVYRSGGAFKAMDIGVDGYDYTEPQCEWFNRPIESKGVVWTAPYFDEGAGNIQMVTFAAPIYRDGEPVGVATVDIDLSQLLELAEIEESDGEYWMVLDRLGTLIYDTQTENIGKSIYRTSYFAQTGEERVASLLFADTPQSTDILSLSGAVEWLGVGPIGSAGWLLFLSVSADQQLSALRSQVFNTVLVVTVLLLIVSLIGWLLVSGILKPIKSVAAAADNLALGDFDISLPNANSGEVGRLVNAFSFMRNELRSREQELKSANEELENRVRERTEMLAESDNNLKLTLSNMPGALIVTGPDMNIKVISEGFNEYVNLPPNYIQVGDSHAKILRYMAENGYYGSHIDIEEAVASRIASIQSPSDTSLVDMLPDGRVNAVTRRRADTGDVVTVVVNVTEQHLREKQLAEAHEQITDSLNYASKIQQAILTGEEMLGATMEEHFIIWEPRDVVGGDIYWCRPWGHGVLVIAADCTGHGVPGAFMTLIASGALDRAMAEVEAGHLGQLVRQFHLLVQFTLNQHGGAGGSDDGLELSAAFIDIEQNSVRVSGARMPLFIVSSEEVEEIKPTKCGIGYRNIPMTQQYEEIDIPLSPKQVFVMASDGVFDQVGGERRRAFGKKRFKELLLKIADLPLQQQRVLIQNELNAYQGDEKRRDDLTIIAFKP